MSLISNISSVSNPLLSPVQDENSEGISLVTRVAITAVAVGALASVNYGRTYLESSENFFSAVRGGSWWKVRLFLAAGMDVDLRDNRGNSALMEAALHGHTEVVQTLIAAGANLELQNGIGYSALTLSAGEEHVEVVQVLIDAGANVDLQNEDGDSTLMTAVFFGYTEVVQALIATGANLDLQNEGGYNALMWAARRGHIEVVQALIKAGAAITLTDNQGRTVRFYAQNNEALLQIIDVVSGQVRTLLLESDVISNTFSEALGIVAEYVGV